MHHLTNPHALLTLASARQQELAGHGRPYRDGERPVRTRLSERLRPLLSLAVKPMLIVFVLATLGLATVGSVETPTAEARIKKWYWTERKAERRVVRHFSDVQSASCIGSGYNWKYNQYGQEVFTAFYCSGDLTDGTGYEITIYTTGNKKFKWYLY
jgi:hypothetical protein